MSRVGVEIVRADLRRGVRKHEAPRCSRCGKALWATNRHVREQGGWKLGEGYVVTHRLVGGKRYCWNVLRCAERSLR